MCIVAKQKNTLIYLRRPPMAPNQQHQNNTISRYDIDDFLKHLRNYHEVFDFLYLYKGTLTSPEQLCWHSGWQYWHSLGPLMYTPVTASHRLMHRRPSRKLRQETHWSSSGPQHPSSEHSDEHTSLSASAITALSLLPPIICYLVIFI